MGLWVPCVYKVHEKNSSFWILKVIDIENKECQPNYSSRVIFGIVSSSTPTVSTIKTQFLT